MAKALPLSAKASAAIHSLDVLRKYGRLGLAGVLLKDELLNLLVMFRTHGGPV